MSARSDKRPGYSLAGYRIKLRNTANRVLLVEGVTDKRAFERLIHEAVKSSNWRHPNFGVVVDTAEILISDEEVMGNRQKVEFVARSLSEMHNLVGFVDREFRDFDLVTMRDLICGHHVDGRLMWSRGHSLENYFFDFDTLVTTIEVVAFSQFHDSASQLACTPFCGPGAK